ncbi:thiamine pyrophosphate-requiring protein [Mesorhizobium sp. YIM 152430]|uniref:thiamine pyrophosphate-requiring protein n=1 Tax=Mesorhizobium sp. YIM 152430 TaxID=3031761 RepID=UPI0023DBC049|nr:thiamine pyrophosphate-requiring protein [Mesorhizobium sp. YIM 152430]MDF1599896.1 thiamine pyrophosphate-requiring protein [Mesorhizobium sp. YIM 152430]
MLKSLAGKKTVGSKTMTAGAALFTRLKALGVDYVFCNSGTDFPPIIEGLAEASAKDIPLPQAIVMPHEHAAMGMAHGYYFATGKAQAVILHTNVGLANGSIGAINAAVDQVPILMMSGRTPVTEEGRFGARTVPIGWGQEMRDQTALVREASKWDYELRYPEQIGPLLDRAHAIANSTPKGPVYLSLPREVLCEDVEADSLEAPPSIQPTRTAPDMALIGQAAKMLAEARNPLIVAQRGAGSEAGFAALSQLASDWSIPVCQWWAVATAIATDHPCHVGADPMPWLGEADVVLVLDALAPWWPDTHKPSPDAKFVHMGPDPLFARTPVRNFRSDVTIACPNEDGLLALAAAMRPMMNRHVGARMKRQTLLSERVPQIRARVAQAAASSEPMSKAYVSKCLSDAISGKNATVLSELGCPLDPMALDRHNSWHQEPHAGGLGWSFPCAMGMQLADRSKLVVATMGDGSYVFSNPVACHQIAEALALPILVVILNNSEWGAVRHSVTGLYPHGYAARANRMPLTSLDPSPDFTKVAEASRAYAVKVTSADDLPRALKKAIRHIEEKRQLALVEVAIG